MKNPKTTLAGYVLLLGALATFVAHALSGTVSGADIATLLQALSGIGLIAASDGGH